MTTKQRSFTMDETDLEIDFIPMIPLQPARRLDNYDRMGAHFNPVQCGTTPHSVCNTMYRNSYNSIQETNENSVVCCDSGVSTSCLQSYNNATSCDTLADEMEQMELMEENLDEECTNSVMSQTSMGYSSIQDGDSECCVQDSDIECYAREIYQQDEDMDTLLHVAIIQQLSNVACDFIRVVPDYSLLNKVNELWQTPLHLAVSTGLKDVVRRLMVAGADISRQDFRGDTPLHIASRQGYSDIVAILMDPVRYEELHQNEYEIPYQKIPQNLEKRNADGFTCLHLAAINTHLTVIRQLLSKGANVNARDAKSGRTILHFATESGNAILVKFLLEQPRIDVNISTNDRWSAIVLAASRGFHDITYRLFEAGACAVDFPPESLSDSDSGTEV